MNIPRSLNILCDRNMPGMQKALNMSEYTLEYAWICLNMPETEPKITVQAK